MFNLLLSVSHHRLNVFRNRIIIVEPGNVGNKFVFVLNVISKSCSFDIRESITVWNFK